MRVLVGVSCLSEMMKTEMFQVCVCVWCGVKSVACLVMGCAS